MKDRRILGEEGFISVFVAVDVSQAKVVAGPELHERGFADDDEIFSTIRPESPRPSSEPWQTAPRNRSSYSRSSAGWSVAGCRAPTGGAR